MTDDLTRRVLTNQLTHAERSLTRDAERLAAAARQFADSLATPGPVSGEAGRLAQAALQVAAQAARVDAMREATSVLLATDTKGTP